VFTSVTYLHEYFDDTLFMCYKVLWESAYDIYETQKGLLFVFDRASNTVRCTLFYCVQVIVD